MGRVGRWKAALRDFREFTADTDADETQVSAQRTEKFVREVTERIFPEAWVFKTGTQQHPDFLVSTREVEAKIREFARGPRGGQKRVTKGLLLSWEGGQSANQGFRFLRLEVKSTTGATFVLNDTFPNPDPADDEVYVMFAGDDRNVYVTTSATMATLELDAPPSIAERYSESKRAVSEFGARLEGIWKDTPVGTAPRPTYSVDVSYARNEADLGVLVGLFARAGLSD